MKTSVIHMVRMFSNIGMATCLFFCRANHRNCQKCRKLLNCANDILHYGVIDVKTVYCKHFPETKYISNKAVRKLMQLPVAVFTLTLQGLAHNDFS